MGGRGGGAVDIDTDRTAPEDLTVADCQARCDDDAECECVVFEPRRGKCWRRGACEPQSFSRDTRGEVDTYVKMSVQDTVPALGYVVYTNRIGSTDADLDRIPGLTVAECQARCDADAQCQCVSIDK